MITTAELSKWISSDRQHGVNINSGVLNDIVSEVIALRAAMEAALPDAARDVLAERQRQMSVEGWTPKHDDEHRNGEMAQAAGCYAMFAAASDTSRSATDLPGSLATLGKPIRGWAAWRQLWPWDRKWWKPTSRRRDLVKAGALILAEIERLDRLTPPGAPAAKIGGE